MRFPYNWMPNILPLQLISIGNFNTNPNTGSKKSALVIAALPGEFTTMSGRRLRNRIHKILNEGFTLETPPPPPPQSSETTPQEQNVAVPEQPSISSADAQQQQKQQPPGINQSNNLMNNNNDYSVIRQKRYLHLYKFLPINRMQSYSDQVHSLSDSYLLQQQNQPTLQVNDKVPPAEEAQNNQQQSNQQTDSQADVQDDQLNKTLEDANNVKGTSVELNAEGYLNSNRIILSGLSNTYSSYVTTFEEYQQQRYEAASTAYGAYTLQAYLQEFSELALKLMDPNLNLTRSSLDEDSVRPPNLLSKQLQFKMPVIYDGVKINSKFGDLIMDVKSVYKLGNMVKVIFRSGHPANWNSAEKTFLTVEFYDGARWKIIATDASWETK